MNVNLPFLPDRTEKTREYGLTMVMDKGLSLRDTESLIESSGDYADLVKFGFGTSVFTTKLNDKIRLYKSANVRPYFGGTLFEAFAIRNLIDEYRRFLDKYGLDLAEVSDGSMYMPHEEKLAFIDELSQQVTVISEVGSKQRDVIIPEESWVKMMKDELDAGSWKVIGEARESGTIGIYNSDGSVNEHLIKNISEHVDPNDIIWETPSGKQQVYFIKLQGCNVNLGNIATNDIIPLECLRRGLRGDTFFDFLPDKFKSREQKPGNYTT